MNVTKSVNQQIDQMKPGKLFSYQDIFSYAEHSDAVVKAISRNSKKLGLVKIKKGLFYKSEIGRFGPMAPKDNDVINYFTSRKNRTTNKREKAELSGLRVSTSPAQHKVTKNNIEILQFLDVLKNIDRIPDADTKEVTNKLSIKLKEYSSKSIKEMEKIAIDNYPERTKAILGFILETYMNHFSDKLRDSLNPTSKYYFSYAYKWEKAQKHWHLIYNKK